MKRLSSTPLGTYLQCPRKFWYGWREVGGPQLRSKVTEAMAFGTLVHAYLEFRGNKGRWPTQGEFAEMKGNYDDPIDAGRAFPKAHKDAFLTAQYVLANHPELLEFDLTDEHEKPLDDFGLTFCDGTVTASGFIDVFLGSKQTIRDYKTRGSFSYMPRTAEDFRADAQQCYYGAAVAGALGWDSIRVEHVNILRPDRGGPLVEVIGVDLPVAYLKAAWDYLDAQVVPEMKRLVETVEDPRDVPVNRSTCFKYGKCLHFQYCGPTHDEASDDPFAFFNQAVSDDPFDGVF